MMKKVAILGFGREGRSILKFLKKSSRYRGIEILDQTLDLHYLDGLERFDLVFRSPGVPYNLSQIQRALKHHVLFSSATKLFFEFCPARIIGVTGTKGKGTTSTLLYQILKKCGFDVHLAGNMGKPSLNILPKLNKKSIVILELSSFQLQDLKTSPNIAVVVDTFPDHLDVHRTTKEYLDAKANITKHQKKSDVVFYFNDNAWSKKIAAQSRGAKIDITGKPFGLKKNYLMASAVATYLGCSHKTIMQVIKNFKGMEHRMEIVREINGIKFFNDSASTNPHTTTAAVLSFSYNTRNAEHHPIILIAGGKDKNLNFSPLAQAIKKSKNIKQIILFGENKNKIKKQVSGVQCPVRLCADLKSSVTLAYKTAQKLVANHHPLVAILFSPGSASFDMFHDYADRGKQFKKFVRQLKSSHSRMAAV